MDSSVGRTDPGRMTLGTPRAPASRTDFDGTVLVEGDHPALFRRVLLEVVDAFFLETNSGSELSFHVFVR